MKKLFKAIIVCTLILSLFSLTGCGGKEQTATYKTSSNGVEMKMTFHAVGDKIDNIHQESIIDTSNYSSSQIDTLKQTSDSYKSKFAKVNGVTYEMKEESNSLTEIIDIKLDNENLQELISSNLLPVTGTNVDYLSFEKTVEQFDSMGWEKVE
ncbi:DUF1307 domain-containing protein [Anaerofustis butyriciformans]|uniref:DUF1307 domain-containing protein n=1 Tax=Anaerofustis TaxID=264995 RepID=UPI003F8AB6C1